LGVELVRLALENTRLPRAADDDDLARREDAGQPDCAASPRRCGRDRARDRGLSGPTLRRPELAAIVALLGIGSLRTGALRALRLSRLRRGA
jgi:hypothetical protein